MFHSISLLLFIINSFNDSVQNVSSCLGFEVIADFHIRMLMRKYLQQEIYCYETATVLRCAHDSAISPETIKPHVC